jgi:exosortase/archaeosortase
VLKIIGVKCDAVHFGIKLSNYLALHTYLKILGTALRISVLTFICYLTAKSVVTGYRSMHVTILHAMGHLCFIWHNICLRCLLLPCQGVLSLRYFR